MNRGLKKPMKMNWSCFCEDYFITFTVCKILTFRFVTGDFTKYIGFRLMHASLCIHFAIPSLHLEVVITGNAVSQHQSVSNDPVTSSVLFISSNLNLSKKNEVI